jgi:hypothetical protein
MIVWLIFGLYWIINQPKPMLYVKKSLYMDLGS